MKKLFQLMFIGLVLTISMTGCGGNKQDAVVEEVVFDEKSVVEMATEFILATQGDKDTIKKLSYPTLYKSIEEDNWSILLVPSITLDKNSFTSEVENISENQYFVKVTYKGEMNKDGEKILLNFENKVGIIQVEDKPLIFSFE